MDKSDVLNLLRDKRFQWAVTAIVLLIVLFMSSSIRFSNWDLLTDHTTGKKIPLALDPFYFLRMAETIVSHNGTLPQFDAMRVSGVEGTAWSSEIMPWVIVGMYRVANIFGDYTLQAVDVASPVIFYSIGLVLFFFLVYVLTRSKAASLISSGLLAFSPIYLYRTMAGFSDHESIGMIALFSCLLIYSIALGRFEKDWKRTALYGAGVGLFTAFTLASWGGAVTFVILVVPFSFLIYWLLKNEDRIKAILFYTLWIISSILFSAVFSGALAEQMIAKFSATSGLVAFAVLGFMIIDFILERLVKIGKLKIRKESKILYSIGVAVVLGSAVLTVIGKNVFELLKRVWYAVLFPFGTGRIGLTVAENAQPYLVDWINQSGSVMFWLFVLGAFLVGVGIGKSIKSRGHSWFFALSWALMISGMLFSRISSSSVFNGESILSQAFYLLGVGVFGAYFVWLNMHRKFKGRKLDSSLILLAVLMFVVILNGRSAIRTFFLITPFVFLSVGYFVMEIFKYALKNKDEVLRIILWGLFLFAIAGVLFSVNSYHKSVINQAERTGPSANYQWQAAMAWVRNNTSEDGIFAHWWDYGYWVQTLGERATIADGGHFQGISNTNERIGRYVLTTNNSATAYSFLKTHNVSYLLIDPTDLGKYGAYSKIGSDKNFDRFSSLLTGFSDEKNIRETSDGMTRFYPFGVYRSRNPRCGTQGNVDEDISYFSGGREIFMPGPTYNEIGEACYKSSVVGVLLKIGSNGTLRQPEAIYVYNGIQRRIPLRRVYFDGRLYDFGKGLNATLRVVPTFQQSGGSGKINPFGAVIYLSPRTEKTLFAKLYLMDDPLDEYSGIKLIHSEDSPIVKILKSQGAPVKDFVYYRGFRGPIKIWKINYPAGTPVYEEFLKPQKSYADMDWRFY